MNNSPETEAGTYSAIELVSSGEMAVVEKNQIALEPESIRLRITATGICGSDVHGIAGNTGRREIGQVMGHETCGVVIEVGSDADKNLLGVFGAVNPVVSCGKCEWCIRGQEQVCEDVWIIGVEASFDAAFAQELVIPQQAFVALNNLSDLALGALVEPLAVGFQAVSRATISPSDRVLVIGAGPIGQAAAIAARDCGASEILVVEPNPLRAIVAEKMGFQVLSSESDNSEIIRRLSGKPSMVLDAVGHTATLTRAIEISAPQASIVLVGMASPEVTLPAYAISTKERKILGSYCYSSKSFIDAARWLESNLDIASQMVDRRVSLGESIAVFSQLLSSEVEINKALVIP